jgi:hypothetical protein
MIGPPPPAIESARVLAYAILDDAVRWNRRKKLIQGGTEVGPVPCLALCQNTWGDWQQIHVFHCNGDWEVLGASGAPTLEEAKASAERSYPGVGAKWVLLSTTREDARQWIRDQSLDLLCSFCDRIPAEMESLIKGNSAAICNHCAVACHARMQPDAEDTDAG